MLVNKNDIIIRQKDKTVFRVLLADAEDFAVVKFHFNPSTGKWDSDYGTMQAFSNTGHDIADLGFKRAEGMIEWEEQ
jgi:hypothetical protein